MTRVRRFRHRGLRVLTQHIPGPLTAIALSVRAGARFDGRHPGIAHMAEHMLFQGTASFDQAALNRRAAELGGEHNADTGYETISLTFEVFNEDVEDALGLMAEQFYRSEVSDARFRKERRVVLDEIRGRMDDPAERLHVRAWGKFFRGALAHPVCGTVQTIRAMDAHQVGTFIRRHFTHAQTVLAVVGGVGEAATRAAVRRHFSAGAPGPAAGAAARDGGRGGSPPHARRRRPGVGGAADRRAVGSAPPHRGRARTRRGRRRPGQPPLPGGARTAGPRIRGVGDAGLGADWAVAVVSASAARAAAQRVVRALNDTCQRAADEGFTPEELVRARKKLRYRYASLADSRFDRALALAEGTLLGFPLPEEAERLVSRMPPAEIEAAWRSVLRGRSLTAVLAD